MAAKSNLETLQAALLLLKERRVELARFLISPSVTRDDVGRYVTSLTATQEAIEVLRTAIGEEQT
jgi:hypothetical protein